MNDSTSSPPLAEKRPKARFHIGLLSILCMPLCFALGWLTRSWTYNRDVDAAAERIVREANGELIPDLGIVLGGRELSERKSEIAQQSAEEKQRRIEFFKRLQTRISDEAARQ